MIGYSFKTKKGTTITVVAEHNKNRYYMVVCSECSKDTELYGEYFTMSKYNILNHQVPCGCSGRFRYTKEQYITKIKRHCVQGGLVGTGKFNPTTYKVHCICKEFGHSNNTRNITTFSSKGGACIECRNNKLREHFYCKDFEQLGKETCERKGLKYVGFIGGYKNMHAKITFECPLHGYKTIRFNDFYRRENKCPDCAQTGFSESVPAHLYIVEWKNENKKFIKYGITNRSVKDRIKQQKYKTNFTPTRIILEMGFDCGILPKIIEQTIKAKFNTNFIGKDSFGDGYTETLPAEYLDDLLMIIDSFIKAPENQEYL